MARKRLGQILIETGLIDEARLNVALREQQRWGGHLGRKLIELKLVKEPDLVRVLSHQLNIPVAPEVSKIAVPEPVLRLLSVEFCQEHSLIPFRQDGRFLDVALCDPTNLSILDEIRIRVRLNVRPFIVGPQELERSILRHYKHVDPLHIARTPSGIMGAVLDNPELAGSEHGLRTIDLAAQAAEAGRMAQRPGKSPHQETRERVVAGPPAIDISAPPPSGIDEAAFLQLQLRVTELEAFLARDETVIRKLLALLVQQKLVTREQILACLQD
jgi:type II secretion system (T2SS) protein E